MKMAKQAITITTKKNIKYVTYDKMTISIDRSVTQNGDECRRNKWRRTTILERTQHKQGLLPCWETC